MLFAKMAKCIPSNLMCILDVEKTLYVVNLCSSGPPAVKLVDGLPLPDIAYPLPRASVIDVFECFYHLIFDVTILPELNGAAASGGIRRRPRKISVHQK